MSLEPDTGPCGLLRLIWPYETLAGRYDVQLRRLRHTFTDETGTIVDATADTDVLVIQRPLHSSWPVIIPMLQAHGVRVVVEIDDDYDHIDPDHPAYRPAHPHWIHDDEVPAGARVTDRADGWSYCPDIESAVNAENLRRSIAAADALVVSTPALAAHYGPDARSVFVVPNFIPARYLVDGHTDTAPLTVGYPGSAQFHPNDLQTVGTGLADVTGIRFVVIGPPDHVAEAVGRRVDGATGWIPYARWGDAVAQLDVAICPLEPTTFNTSKSWLKPLECAAAGVVPVMSPTPEYVALHELGVGLLARTPDEWAAHLQALVAQPDLRAQLRGKGLEVARGLTIEGNAVRFLQAWTGEHAPAERRPRVSTIRRDVTAVIPTIPSRSKLLHRALASVAAQTQPVEAIAVAVDTARGGAWDTRNRAALTVRTTWTAFLDDDDEWFPHHVEHLLDCAEEHDADLVWAWFDVVAPYGVEGGHGSDPWPENRGRQYDPARPHVVPITYVVRTELLHDAMTKMGGFLPDIARDGPDLTWQHQDAPVFDTMIALGARTFASPVTSWKWWHWRGNTSGLPTW